MKKTCVFGWLMLAATGAWAGPVTISSSTALFESQSALYTNSDVTVSGANVVLTLSNSATYGTLAMYSFNSLIVTNGASIVCLGQTNAPYDANAMGVAIQVAGNLIIAGDNITNSINADGAGFRKLTGPGCASGNGIGGTYGGLGMQNPKPTYGSPQSPTCLGSGGGGGTGYGVPTDGPAGGAIKLMVAGNLIVNGRLSANGVAGYNGGGSGGSVWITGGCTLGGTGEVQVSGATAGNITQAGGGGRISVDDTVTCNFQGNIRGANGSQANGADTYPPGEIVHGCGGPGSIYFGALARQNFTVYSNKFLIVGNDIENVFSNLTVYGTLAPGGSYVGLGTGAVIRATNITIAASGQITADGWGFGPGQGPASGANGGNHGGRGGSNTNALYGSVTQPTSMGSGGGNGAGGGGIKLAVSGNLTINGVLSANGGVGHNNGSGAGGSIWITGGGTVNGTGSIRAYSAGDYNYGTGGGGRISIDDTMTYAFQGNIQLGTALYDDTPGTLYLPANARNNFLIDTSQSFIIGNGTTYSFGNLMVKGTLDCGGDPWLATGGTGIVITANNLTIWSNAVVKADSRGFYGADTKASVWAWGPGAGSATIGATHAGKGYDNPTGTYGSATQPTTLGSGGNAASGQNGNAYFGGGAIKLAVATNLTIYGTLSANGGFSGTSGGSAGGSIWIDAGTIAGNGNINANGGANAAGGGGGRGAVYYNTCTFSGMPAPSGLYQNQETVSAKVTAKGGYNVGANGVEDGTIYVLSKQTPLVDNAIGATNVNSTSAWLTGTLLSTGAAATTVYCFWGPADGTNNLSAWAHTDTVNTVMGPVSNYVSGLASPPTAYYYRFYATNSFGDYWASPSKSFQTIVPPVVNNYVGATGIQANQATLNGQLVSGGTAHVFIYWGTNSVSPENTVDLSTETQLGGPFSTSIAGLTPVTHYYYQCYATNANGASWAPITNFWTTTTLTFTSPTNLLPGSSATYSNMIVVVSGCTLTLSNSPAYGTLTTYYFGGLLVTNGGSVVCLGQNAGPVYDASARGVAIQSAGDVIIAGGCNLNADGKGFLKTQGPGGSSAGGTYGGRGDQNAAATYGSATQPLCLGSGGNGGTGGGSDNADGPAGGAIKLIVASNLVVNGRLSANGLDGRWGGASGGSIWITGGCTLGGTGEVQTAGGPSTDNFDAGGGGGRLSIDDTVTYNFQGNIRGALGYQQSRYGGVGSVYLPATARQNFTVVSNQTLVIGNDIVNVFSNLTVYGTLIPGGFYAGFGTGAVIQAANITIASGGAIMADGWGFAGGYGPSLGNHGGRGASNTNALYGSLTQPICMGSGCSSGVGAGGGAMELVVSGNVIVNGMLSANSLNNGNNTGSGAGGSIWITGGGTLGGTGEIQAVANNPYYYGTGGGGRVSIDDTMTYAFQGNIRLALAVYDGCPGTLYLPASARNSFLIDTNQTLVIGNGSICSFGNLIVNGTLECGGDPWLAPGGTGLVITANTLTIGTNATIEANSRGFYGVDATAVWAQGPGVGSATIGATHGGMGYNNPTSTYGSAMQPTTLGSGGYTTANWSIHPDVGGGAIHLVVANSLTINGTLSANGGFAKTYGGSAGGSIWIDAGAIAGNGNITANGGANAAGGGGGRIAVYYHVASAFAGLPAPGLYTGMESVSSSVTVKGGYNLGFDGPEDGSIYIAHLVPPGTTIFIR